MQLTSATLTGRFGIRFRAASLGAGAMVLGLSGLVALPILLVRFAPLTDFVNHLARVHVIALAGRDPLLAGFYAIDWQILPNLAIDILAPPLARLVGVYAAGKLFLLLTVLTLATGPSAIHYALRGRLGLWPAVAFLFVYNQVFIVGLANYLLGAGIAAWGLAAFILLAERSVALRVAASFVVVVLTFFCHLSALGLYGVAIGSYTLWRFIDRRGRVDRWLLREGVVLVLPVVPMVPLFLGSATVGLAPELAWDPQGKFDAVMMIFRSYADGPDLAILVLGGIALGWAVVRRHVEFHPAALVLAVTGGIVFLAMPSMLFGSYMADQRLPVALFLMLIGFGRLDERDAALRAGFVVLVLAFSAIRVGGVSLHWLHLAAAHEDLRVSLAAIEPGAKILVAHADAPSLDGMEADALSHGPCAAIIERSALVSTAFTVPGKQIMRVRPPYDAIVDTEDGDPPRVSQLLAAVGVEGSAAGSYWDGWERRHDYLFVLYTGRDDPDPDPDLLERVYDGEGFRLFRIRH